MDQILSNIDILKTIFDYLELQEQINLARVCGELKDLIVNYLWHWKYRQLQVYQLENNLFLLSNNHTRKDVLAVAALKNEHFDCLQQKDIKDFLLLQKENIFELELCDYRNDIIKEIPNYCTNIEWKFPNLKILKLNFIQLDVTSLNSLRRNCSKLEILHLNQCKNANLEIFILKDENNLHYKELMHIVKILKEFHIEYQERKPSPYALNLYDFLLNDNLNKLNLNIPINNIGYREVPRLHVNSCEQLELAVFNEYKALQKFCRLYLNIFENLQVLYLEGSLNKLFIDTTFIKNLGNAAPKLKHLKLKRCLINVHDFGFLHSLQEIYFNNCMSLTWLNLKQLLESAYLKMFHTYHSTYTGEFVNFFLSSSLESLTLIGNEDRFSEIFFNTQQMCSNLKQLYYYDDSHQVFPNLSQKFPNLEILHILPHHLECRDLLCLKRLKIYKNPKYNYSITFNHLLYLIKHSSLSELSITYADVLLSDNNCSIAYPLINSNLKYITIDFALFNYIFEFWLDLLKANKKLTLIVRADEISDLEYYSNLLMHTKFCRKYIKLNGFQFDYQDIITSPDVVKRKLSIISQISEFRNVNIII